MTSPFSGQCARTSGGDDEGAVMAQRPCGRVQPILRLLLLLLLALLAAGSTSACAVDECSQRYGDAVLADPATSPAPAKLCAALHKYRECVRSKGGACHGNLGYHSALTIVRRHMQKHKCPGAASPPHHASPSLPRHPLPSLPPPGRDDDDEDDDAGDDGGMLVIPPRGRPYPLGTTAEPLPPPAAAPDPACDYRGPGHHVHCGLFGDPHLKTFGNAYQTCRVQGAWPLIDNPHLAVQVTNEPVVHGSRATATTKVTVIVRGGGGAGCSSHRKMYEATADAPLPATFVDGTQRSPGGNVQLQVYEEGHRVEILVRHVDALVVVRRAGRYLAFSARLPKDIAFSGASPGGLQLCAQGCPPQELLHPQEDRGEAMSQEAAELVCGASNLTGSYHDWCVFDVMTTGADDFASAAQAALTDVRRLDPASNRGSPTSRGSRQSGPLSGSAPTAPASLLASLAFLLLRYAAAC